MNKKLYVNDYVKIINTIARGLLIKFFCDIVNSINLKYMKGKIIWI